PPHPHPPLPRPRRDQARPPPLHPVRRAPLGIRVLVPFAHRSTVGFPRQLARADAPQETRMAIATHPTSKSDAAANLARGLEGVVAGESAICSVEQGKLIYRGYEIHDLAANATFEEGAFLLLEGHQPSAEE